MSTGNSPDLRQLQRRAHLDVEASVGGEIRFAAVRERERRIIFLRFFEEMSQSEIAEQVGTSQVHVSRLIRASLERMRAAAGTP